MDNVFLWQRKRVTTQLYNKIEGTQPISWSLGSAHSEYFTYMNVYGCVIVAKVEGL